MKTMGRASRYDEIEQEPSTPFIEDIKKDILSINDHYSHNQSIEIKKKMIQEILNSM
tara:strand:- start:365 stop:535 length:171 start_codon:yes stop_codon:yes gene_type:complete